MSEEILNEQTKEKTESAEQAIIEEPAKDIVIETAVSDEEIVEEAVPIEEQLAVAQAEAARNLDSFLRAQAELSNARKRFEKQRQMAYTNAQADLISKLLPVLDDFGRALNNVPDAIRADNWLSGIDLVERKMRTILENMNVTPIEALGQPFDPNFHEALGQEPSDEFESGSVCREMLKGYQIGSQVIRPALVYVAE